MRNRFRYYGYVSRRSKVMVPIIAMTWLFWLGAGGTLLFGQHAAFAQDVQAQLDRYYAANTPLVIDIEFNQPAYVPGDTAWFSLWLTTEREGLPVAGRQVVNVNLATREGKVVLSQRVLVSNGLGHAQIAVPPTLEPGVYTVVSWTGWMLNDGIEMYSYKKFVVSGENTFAPDPMPAGVYAEGGVLASAVQNQLFVTGRAGTTMSLYAGGQETSTVKLDNAGYGKLSVTPMADVAYSVTDGQSTVKLPKAVSGVALALDCRDSASTITLNLHARQVRDGCQLTIVSRGKVLYAATVSFQDQQASVTIPKRILPDEPALATVFDGERNVLAQRLFLARLPGSTVKVKVDRVVTHPRERVSAVVEAEPGGTPVTVNIYADEVFAESISPPPFIERLPQSSIHFTVDPSWNLQQWNDFLGTQSWKRFEWSAIWNGRGEREHALNKYLKFKGKVLLSEEGSFDSVRVTFFLRKEARIYEAYTSPKGDFDIDLFFDFDDVEEIVYTVDRKGAIIKDARIQLADAKDPGLSFRPFTRTTNVDPYPAFARIRQSLNDAYRSYEIIKDLNVASDLNARVEDELFEADVTVKLDEYVLFPTMEETLREIVPRLQHRWRGKHHTVRVALSEPDILASAEPLYFIDGVLTDDTDYFMSLKPADVATIKIVSTQRKLQAMGIFGRNGVVLVTTKLRDSQLHVPRTRQSFTAIGFTRPATFDNGLSTSPRTPMLRASAYLNPALQLDANGKGVFEFLLPDNVGNFRIEVSGLSRAGTHFKTVTRVRSVPPPISP